jgi:DNA-binding response OmpR family regulator
MRILIVEDDPALKLGLKRRLLDEGWQVDAVDNGELAIEAAHVAHYDFAVLDINLPRKSGFEVLSAWRQAQHNHPVLILTARDELSDRLTGLNGGADDYLTKPFEVEELVARIRVIARRRAGTSVNQLQVGPLCFDIQSRQLLCANDTIALTPREAALMELLMTTPNKAVTKQRIVAAMSSWESDFSANAVEIYVMKLRRKLVDKGVRIETIRGVGYALELEVQE